MTEQPHPPASPTPTHVPYVEFHTGPKRSLVLHLTSGNLAVAGNPGQLPPVVSIDGRHYIVYWGTVAFEIPADRACHVSVHVEGDHLQQAATTLLAPGDPSVPVVLTYETHSLSGVGSLR